MSEALNCPLCGESNAPLFFQDKRRPYHRCNRCFLVFVPKPYHLTVEQEKAEYDKHENQLEEPGYLKFLSRMYEPIHERVAEASQGLDFGCGPAPALANRLNQLGHEVVTYDLYYQPDTSVLRQEYDFVTCTEVIEHLASPAKEFERMLALLKPAGLLGIMTKLVINKDRFANWHYKNDMTHISFFSRRTFEYLAATYRLQLEFIGSDVMLFTKAR